MTFSDLTPLDQFRAVPLPANYPANIRTLYSPVDQVHAALLAVVTSAEVSLDIAVYGFDDDAVADAIKAALLNPAITVSLTLDRSQAGGRHEREILARESYPASDIVIGTSEHNAIMHMKSGVVDKESATAICWRGSTNLSTSGESLQDNELTFVQDPVVATEEAARIDAIHAWMIAHPHHRRIQG